MIYLGAIVFILGGALMYMGRRQKSMQQEMQKSHVIPIRDVQAGQPAEIYGTVSTEHPLMTPYSKRECVYYEYTLERQTRVENAQGGTSTRWERVSHDSQRTPFWLQDNSGNIMVQPDGAQIDGQPLGEQLIQSGDAVSNPLFSTVVNMLTNNAARARETALFTNAPAYIFGDVSQGTDGLTIGKGKSKFFISHKTETEVEKDRGRSAMLWMVFGIICFIGGVVLVVISL